MFNKINTNLENNLISYVNSLYLGVGRYKLAQKEAPKLQGVALILLQQDLRGEIRFYK